MAPGWFAVRHGRCLVRRDSAFAATSRPLPAVVHRSVGSDEFARPVGTPWRECADALGARTDAGLRLTTETLAGETHVSVPGAAFPHGSKPVFRTSPDAHAAPGR